jgi:hypothetical protein
MDVVFELTGLLLFSHCAFQLVSSEAQLTACAVHASRWHAFYTRCNSVLAHNPFRQLFSIATGSSKKWVVQLFAYVWRAKILCAIFTPLGM